MTLLYRPYPSDNPKSNFYIVHYREDVSDRPPRELEIGRVHRSDFDERKPWKWSIHWIRHFGRKQPHMGNAKDLETAKAALERCWKSATPPIDWSPAQRLPTDPIPRHQYVGALWD